MGTISMETRLLVAIFITIVLIVCAGADSAADTAVDSVQPRHGGTEGHVRLTIHGKGFPDRGLQALPGNKGQGVELWLVSDVHQAPCTLDTDEVTANIIICFTRPLPEDNYVLAMSVDGKQVPKSKLCKANDWSCGHFTRNAFTPRIYTMVSNSGAPGSVISFWGTIFTNKSDSASFGSVNGNSAALRRVYIGQQLCQLKKNDTTDELYGLNLDSGTSLNGRVKCKVLGITVANRNMSFILDGIYGGSGVDPYVYRESASGQLYMYQTHAVVNSSSPKEGSTQGGTLLEVCGNYFDPTPGATKVMVGSGKCNIKFINDTLIRCRTPADPGDTEFGGGRGILMEGWNTSAIYFDKFDDVLNLNSSSSGYFVREFSDFGWYEFDAMNRYNTRVRAYFVAPRDSNYTFYLASDDSSRVTFYNSAKNGTKLFELSCPKYCFGNFHWRTIHRYKYSHYPETQVSRKISLKKGQRLFIDAIHVDIHSASALAVGVKIHKTSFNEHQASHAYNERHRITLKTAMLNEKQRVRLVDWTTGTPVKEVQKVKLTLADQQAASDVSYKIGLFGAKTATLQYGISAADLQRQINFLPSLYPDTVSLSRSDVSGGYEYTVTINGDRGDMPLLQVTKGPNSQSLMAEVTESTQGKGSGRKLYFNIAGVPSPGILNTATAAEVTRALNDALVAQCPRIINSGEFGSFFWGMEPNEQNFHKFGGKAVEDDEAFCGHFSYKNPTYLYLSTVTHKLYDIDLNMRPHLCFAYKGQIKNEMTVSYLWAQNGQGKSNVDNLPLVVNTDGRWHYNCINVRGVLETFRVGGSNFRLRYIKVHPAGPRGEFYLDVISNRRTVPTEKPEDAVGMRLTAARPGGSVLKQVIVNKTANNEFVIEMISRYCGHNNPLIKFTNNNWQGQSRVEVQRLQAASKPVGGSLDITYRGNKKTIKVTMKPEEIANELMTIEDIGVLKVTQEGNCSCLIYEVEFKSLPGDQDPPQIDTSSLTDFINSSVETLMDGGFMFDRIPGEFLQRVAKKPQVSVIVNNISSNATGDVSYQYKASITPTITTISPTSGGDTTLTIAGNDFTEDTSIAEDTSFVKIGKNNCTISSHTDTAIICLLKASVYGQFKVNVTVKGKGMATHSQGEKMFKVQGTISSISPASATNNGGVVLTISGKGLASAKTVTVEGQGCAINSSMDTTIKCIVPKRQGSGASNSVDVVVNTAQDSLTSSTQLTYTAPQNQARISGVSPSTADVWGGSTVTISGSNFGQQQGDSYVAIGNKAATVTSWAVAQIEVKCPDSEPGIQDLVINVASSGFAAFDVSISTGITYTLEISNISPMKGSLFGGSDVTITGNGFPTQKTLFDISFGSTKCDVMTTTSTKVVCQLRSTFRVHKVTNRGITPGVGPGFRWEPPSLRIEQGDIVHWIWSGPPLLQNFKYGVFQTKNATTEEVDEAGFSSGLLRTPKGSFHRQFWTEGSYFYTSKRVDKFEKFVLNGAIKVVPKPSASIGKLNITMAGKTPTWSSATPCPGTQTGPQVQGCSVPEPTTNSTDKCVYKFWECLTPIVTTMTPSSDNTGATLTISGEGFDSTASNNVVDIAKNYSCVTTSASSTVITCKVDHNGTMPVNKALPAMLRLKNNGYPKLSAGSKMAFVLEPKVVSVSPSAGSLQGGTNVTITGYGFTGSPAATAVNFANTNTCPVVSVNYTHIICVTRVPGSSRRKKRATQSVTVAINYQPVNCTGNCEFVFSANATPTVTQVTPSTIKGSSTTLTLTGTKFGTDSSKVQASIGNSNCVVQSVTDTQISCTVGPVIVGVQKVKVTVMGLGRASVDAAAANVTVEPEITSISPGAGSINGGTNLTITGGGFDPSATSVTVAGTPCRIMQNSSTISKLTCVTPAMAAKQADVVITSNAVTFPAQKFNFSADATPVISTMSPTSGSAGTTVTITGTGFSTTNADNHVTIGGKPCSVTSSTPTSVLCQVPQLPANDHGVIMAVTSKGLATSSAKFTSVLTLSSVTPSEGSLAGGTAVTLTGSGFDASKTTVLICGRNCTLQGPPTASQAVCISPMMTGTTDKTCNTTVTVQGVNRTLANSFTYKASLTPEVTGVSPTRGGTGGGTVLIITGTGFGSSGNKVRVNGEACDIRSQTATQITCTTNASPKSVKTQVEVTVPGKGFAKQTSADFTYANDWSNQATWGNGPLPVKGDFIVIKDVVLLDVDTPVLEMLLIQGPGGKLIFDDDKALVVLRAKKVLITDGGTLQIGTKENPYKNKARIELYGHAMSKELPLYGTKVLAVRNGTLDMHGTPVISWTLLASTAAAGTSSITLKLAVDWKVGDEVVIATTGTRHSQKETEVRKITAISADKKTLTLDKALQYKHICVTETLGSAVLETCAEVGLLTRNVAVRGNDDVQWQDEILACPDGFDTGEFATQTCFQGRFGDETGSNNFGAQIFISSPIKNTELAIARIEYVEVSHAGQAFRLARYPIHFHLQGKASSSYVRGCSIHHTFNRAINIHGSHEVLIEQNVAYDVMGGAFFLEDGIETGNIFQYNLVLFAKASTSLLNDDITPAGFWITNPNNTVRHNHVAGGTHFGFWYRMFEHPSGPSFTATICPQNIPVKEFFNNTVHSQGWFGLWIFEHYFPKENGDCKGADTTAVFSNFYAWNNEKGAEWVDCGAMQFKNFIMYNNEKAGIEAKLVTTSKPYMTDGPVISDSYIVGHLGMTEGSEYCTNTGIVLPFSAGLRVKNVTFVNFDRTSCKTLGITSVQGKCTKLCGGFHYRFEKVNYINSPNKMGFRWTHEGILVDVDGTLTQGTAGRSVVAKMNILPPTCTKLAEFSKGDVDGHVCEKGVTFNRFAFNKAHPPSVQFKNLVIKNQYGTDVSPWADKRITHKQGWMVTLVSSEAYFMFFENAGHITNMTYIGEFYELEPNDNIIMSTNVSNVPDIVQVYPGEKRNSSSTPLDKKVNRGGDWYFNTEENKVQYFVSYNTQTSGRRKRATVQFDPASNLQNKAVHFESLKCYYTNCIAPLSSDNKPPPVDRPSDALFWSMSNAEWQTKVGIPKPTDNTDVVIPKGKWIVIDVSKLTFRTLNISGVLEFEYKNKAGTQQPHDIEITADVIVISGGRFHIGWPNAQDGQSRRFRGKAVIKLRGSHSTEEFRLPPDMQGPPIGTKAIGVFGAFEAWGIQHTITWTRLSDTASKGSTSISLREAVDWAVTDQIVISTTSFKAAETEVVTITSISADKKTLNVSPALKYTHLGKLYTVTGSSVQYEMAAEVGLLSRNIKITSDNVDIKESFGVRVVVGLLQQGTDSFTGYARLDNVEFNRAGQEGYTSQYDPRFQLSFINAGTVSDIKPSRVTGCSFNNGFSPAIGVFATKQLVLENNVIYHTVGGGIIAGTEQLTISKNLITNTIWPGAYNGRRESTNFAWNGGIEIVKSNGITMKNNVVAGSERAGYRIYNRPCPISATGTDPWEGNVAHSVLTGVALFSHEAEFGQCLYVHGFYVYKAADYGFYIQGKPSIRMRNIMSVDNLVGVYPMVIGPSAVDHLREDKYVKIEKSTFIGRSPNYDCNDNMTKADPNYEFSSQARYVVNGTKHHGIAIGTFSEATNNAPKKPWANLMAYPSIGGITILDEITFANFDTGCGGRDFFIVAPKNNDDLIHPVKTSKVVKYNSDKKSYVYISRPRMSVINPSDCVDMDCDGLKKVLITDTDGSFLGAHAAAISQSEFEWDGDRRRGLGDYRIPKEMMTDPSGKRLNMTEIAPNKGIVRNSQCTYMSPWNGYECQNINYKMLIIESMDADTETRRVSPLAIYNPVQKYVDLINGPQDHGWCSGYTCQKRLSTFAAVVPTGMESQLYFTSTNPQKIRFHLLDSASSASGVLVGVHYRISKRVDVYVNNRLIQPKNAQVDAKGTVTYKAPTVAGEFKPTFTDGSGSNWFDQVNKLIYVLMKGKDPVDVLVSSEITVSLDLPPMTVDEFYNGENIVNNLAKFLGIPSSRIKITKIVRAGGSRKKRATGSVVGVEITIMSPPADTLTTTGNSTLEAARSEMLDMSEKIVAATQAGNLGNQLNTTVLAATIEEPLPPPDSKAWQERVNQTGQRQAILIPDRINVVQGGIPSSEGAPFSQHIAIEMLDANGTRVELLGSSTNPWKMMATLRKSQGSDARAVIVGDATVDFRMGWANFSTLSISHSGSGYMLDIVGTYPASSSKYTASVGPFNVTGKSLKANVSSQPNQVAKNSSFSLTVDILDPATGAKVKDLSWKGHNWTCSVLLEGSDGYSGRLHVGKNCDVPKNGTIIINKLALSSIGQTFIKVRVQSTPNDFDLLATTEAIHIEPPAKFSWQATYKKVMKMKFKQDYDKLTTNKKRRLKAVLKNKLAMRNPDVSFSDISLTKGSVVAEFEMTSGQRTVLESSSQKVASDVKSGAFSVNLDGETMTADGTVWVDGQAQNDTNVSTAEPTTETSSKTTVDSTVPTNLKSGLSAGVIAAIVICAIIVVIVLVAIVAYCLLGKKKKVGDEKWAMASSPRGAKPSSAASVRSYSKVHPEKA